MSSELNPKKIASKCDFSVNVLMKLLARKHLPRFGAILYLDPTRTNKDPAECALVVVSYYTNTPIMVGYKSLSGSFCFRPLEDAVFDSTLRSKVLEFVQYEDLDFDYNIIVKSTKKKDFLL